MLGMLLVTSLVTTNVVTATHRTALDPDFMTETLEEEGFYGVVENQTVTLIGEGLENATDTGVEGSSLDTGLDPERVADRAVTEAYVRSQTERNVVRTYAYLHGNRDDLNLTVNLVPLKANVTAAVEASVRNVSVGEVVGETGALNRTDAVNASVIERMDDNRSAYQDAKADVRSGVREQVLDRAVQVAWENATNDQKLALVIDDYDPRNYTEAEKQQLVDENEDAIRAELRDSIERERGDEIDRRIDERLQEAATTAQERAAEAETDDGNATARIEAAALDLQATVVTGLATDMTYDTYTDQLDDGKAELANATGDLVGARLDEAVPDRQSLSDLGGEADQELETALEPVRETVGILDTLGWLLPLLSLVLIGLIFAVSRSLYTTSLTTGVGALAAGLPAYVTTVVAREPLADMVSSAGPEAPALSDTVLSVANRVLDVFATQSLVLVVLGLVLVGVAVALHLGYVADPLAD